MFSNEFVSKRTSNGAAKLLFLIGLFSQLQVNVGGKLGLSEIVMLVLSPFVFLKHLSTFKRDGSLTFIKLLVLWLVGAIFVDCYTHNYIHFAMRGIAVPITLFSNVVCIYVILRKDLRNLKWFLLGSAISGVLCIFILQNGSAGDVAQAQGMEAGINAVMDYKLFWLDLVRTWLTLPIMGWYLQAPKLYVLGAMSFVSFFSLFTGGRSTFMVSAVTLLFFILVGKTRWSMAFLKKHFFLIVLCISVLGFVGKSIYKYAATSGYMGEEEERKYESQTSGGGGIINLLVSGRGSTFIGLTAIADHPFMGHGSVPIDNHGYVLDFFSRYGNDDDVRQIQRSRERFGARIIPSHSHIITYWLWHGILGLLFWLYVLYISIKTLLSRMHIYPGWFGYFAVMIPAFLWDLFFSPLGMRVAKAAMFAAFLLVAKLQREQERGLSPIIG